MKLASSICNKTTNNETFKSRANGFRSDFAVVSGLIFVALASFYDAYLVFKFRHVITEHNPVCNWLIEQEPEYVSLFLLAKITSTLVVIALLGGLYRYRAFSGMAATGSLVVFQVGLMGYIHHSDPIPSKRNDSFLVGMFSGKASSVPIKPNPGRGKAAPATRPPQMRHGLNSEGSVANSQQGKRPPKGWKFRERQRRARARTRQNRSPQKISREISDAI